MNVIKRVPFTLMEMLVVLILLSLSLGAIGIQVHRFLTEQRFLNDVRHVVRQLQMAQDLMLVMDTDVVVDIRYNSVDGGYISKLSLEKKPIKMWRKIFDRPPPLLKSIDTIEFNEVSGSLENGISGITLRFPAGGVGMPKGTLTLKGPRSELTRAIVLQGAPAPFEAKDESYAGRDYKERSEDASFRSVLTKVLTKKEEVQGVQGEEKK